MVADLVKKIKNGKGFVVSEGTLNPVDLICTYYDLLVKYKINPSMQVEIRKLLKIDNKVNASYEYFNGRIKKVNTDNISDYVNLDIYDYFNSIAPKGYYFGSHEGDGACVGWFMME